MNIEITAPYIGGITTAQEIRTIFNEEIKPPYVKIKKKEFEDLILLLEDDNENELSASFGRVDRIECVGYVRGWDYYLLDSQILALTACKAPWKILDMIKYIEDSKAYLSEPDEIPFGGRLELTHLTKEEASKRK